MQCTNCNNEFDSTKNQMWHLSKYFGISGTFCPRCYEKVSHDSYGKPNHPKQYKAIYETYLSYRPWG